MFFFIGGITPKTKRLEDRPVRCPVCGLSQAYKIRVDQWLHLFFIPVFPVKRGQPFLFCERCNRQVDGQTGGPADGLRPDPNRCPSCGHAIERDFRYCPLCGQRLSSDG